MKNILDILRVLSIRSMGHLRIFTICGYQIGYEQWGLLRPARMWRVTGECWRPLFAGLWTRDREHDRLREI